MNQIAHMIKLFTILFALLSATSVAQTASIKRSPQLVEASAASVGMSKERLARIDHMCRNAINNDELPGIVALVARNGKIVYYKAFGLSDNQTGRALERNDIFRIASQTKALTATAVMMLWEEGKFRLDDPISKYIPEFQNAQVLDTLYEDSTYKTRPANKEISIRHLLTHTSGVGYGIINSDKRFRKIYGDAGIIDAFTTQNITIAENIKKLARLPLHHDPGQEYTYGEGLDILGYLVEIVAGIPLDTFFRARIFEPLKMDDSWFYLPKEKHDRLVSVQRKKNGKWIEQPITFYDPDYPIKGAQSFFAGGAGISCTAKDYATFLQMYLNEGELNGIRLLSRTTVQFMMSNQIGNLAGWQDKHYGLAFGIVNQIGQDSGGNGSKGTFYWSGYFNTQFFADPKEQVIGILMKQTQGVNDDTGNMFRTLVMQAVDD